MSKSLHICIDSNEASKQNKIITYLKFNGFKVEIKPLDVCDYVISDRVGVERKNTQDFLSSLKDGRLFSQAQDMAKLYERPIIILEGQMKKALKKRQIHPNSVYGALSSLALDFGVNIIPTDDQNSTAMLIHRLCYREQAKEERVIQLRSINRSLPLDRQQVYLISGLPQIGTTLAEDLLNTFETPYQVLVKFTEAEIYSSPSGKTKRLIGPLSKVKGIGPKIVESTQQLLNESYPNLCYIEEK